MPYVDPAIREAIDAGAPPLNVGELTYKISAVIEQYRQEHLVDRDRFQTLAECEEACHAAAAEFRRVVIDPFEQVKLEQTSPVHAAPIL